MYLLTDFKFSLTDYHFNSNFCNEKMRLKTFTCCFFYLKHHKCGGKNVISVWPPLVVWPKFHQRRFLTPLLRWTAENITEASNYKQFNKIIISTSKRPCAESKTGKRCYSLLPVIRWWFALGSWALHIAVALKDRCHRWLSFHFLLSLSSYNWADIVWHGIPF